MKGCSRNALCTAHKGTQKIVPLRPMRPSRYTGWTRERSASTLEGAPRSRHAATLSGCLALDAELDSTSGRELLVRAPGRPWLMVLRSRATAEHVPLDVHQSPHAAVRPLPFGRHAGQAPAVHPTTTLRGSVQSGSRGGRIGIMAEATVTVTKPRKGTSRLRARLQPSGC